MAHEAPLSKFADTILRNKRYVHTKDSGHRETWPEVAVRVVENVVRPNLPKGYHHICEPLTRAIQQRKIMPGGRYLYAAGRRYPQINNCLSGNTKIITKEGIFELQELVGKEIEVRNRFGEWEKATVHSFGYQHLKRIRFTSGEMVLATANHLWWMEDGSRISTMELNRVPLSETASYPNLNEEGIRHGVCYGDGTIQRQINTDRLVLVTNEKRYLSRYFSQEARELSAGLTITKLPRKYKKLPNPKRCTPEYARGFIAGLIATDGSTKTSSVTISCNGRRNAKTIRDLAVLAGCVPNKIMVNNSDTNYGSRNDVNYIVSLKPFSVPLIRPDQIAEKGKSSRRLKMWMEVRSIDDYGLAEVFCCVVPGSESFTLANGLITSNCFLFRAEDSKEGWGTILSDSCRSLMTGGGVGSVYSNIRGRGTKVEGLGGECTGPISLMAMVNENGRYIRQGGSRRSALWAGLHWWHPDIFDFITIKDWDEDIQRCKRKNFNFPAPMDGTNISVIFDDDFFAAYHDRNHPKYNWACNVYWTSIRQMLRTGEPGFSVDIGDNSGENLRNACTEVTSKTNRDMCNLLSLTMSRITSAEELAELVELGTILLLCGTPYSKLPIPEMYTVREQNRRLGLGLMGIHEWLLQRGKRYGPDDELAKWLAIYANSTSIANEWADRLSISRPVATRSIAPTGTISIIAETTSGIEPILATAYKRRYLDGGTWKAQYVVDPAAQRLVDKGIDPSVIEDSYDLANNVARRVDFQGWVQQYVDHGISSTINLPRWGSTLNNESTVTQFGNMLIEQLPRVRGITTYPDGSRGGQPLNRVSYYYANERLGQEFTEESESGGDHGTGYTEEELGSCKSGVCGE